MKSILYSPPKECLEDFLNRYKNYSSLNMFKPLEMTSIETVKYYKNQCKAPFHIDRLWNKWEKSRDTNPDYSVYSDEYYTADLWSCWVIYSRQYLKGILNPERCLQSGAVIDYINPVKSVLDTGNGFGYTTASLKEIFPNADVIGMNLKDTIQYKFSCDLAKERRFRMVPDIKDIKGPVDLIFSSEYYEHILNPIDHLLDIIERLNPKVMLIANTFNPNGIGHFNYYKINGEKVTAKNTAKIFNETLRLKGYHKIKTKFWNNKPVFWKKETV